MLSITNHVCSPICVDLEKIELMMKMIVSSDCHLVDK